MLASHSPQNPKIGGSNPLPVYKTNFYKLDINEAVQKAIKTLTFLLKVSVFLTPDTSC